LIDLSTCNKHTKNRGEQEFLVKKVEFNFISNSSFPQSTKSASYNKTNSSVMAQMHQTPAPLELKNKGQEKQLLPAKKIGVEIKLLANQSKAFAHRSKYAEEQKLPQEYENYRVKEQSQRNKGNQHVEMARAITYNSNVF